MTKVLRFLKSLSPFRRQVKIQIVSRDVCRLTATEWRSQPDMTKLASRALSDPIVRQMLDVLRTSHLARYTHPGNSEQKAFHLCRCEGYSAALNELESLAVHSQPKEELEATFESPESDTE